MGLMHARLSDGNAQNLRVVGTNAVIIAPIFYGAGC